MKVDARTLDFFDRYVSQMIVEKYGINDREAVRLFFESEPYQMLMDAEQGEYKNETAPQILKKWDEKNITDFIYDMYEIYHVERLENAFKDIDSLIATGKCAW